MESSFSTDSGSETDSAVLRWADKSEDERTPVMLRGLDTIMDRDALLAVLNASSFRGCFDFIYVPCDFNTRQPQGFCFVNFTNHMDAQQFQLQPPASLGTPATLESDQRQLRLNAFLGGPATQKADQVSIEAEQVHRQPQYAGHIRICA